VLNASLIDILFHQFKSVGSHSFYPFTERLVLFIAVRDNAVPLLLTKLKK
jgi:hypothetical protein